MSTISIVCLSYFFYVKISIIKWFKALSCGELLQLKMSLLLYSAYPYLRLIWSYNYIWKINIWGNVEPFSFRLYLNRAASCVSSSPVGTRLIPLHNIKQAMSENEGFTVTQSLKLSRIPRRVFIRWLNGPFKYSFNKQKHLVTAAATRPDDRVEIFDFWHSSLHYNWIRKQGSSTLITASSFPAYPLINIDWVEIV